MGVKMVMNRLVPKPQRARLQNKTITENGTYYADDGFDGFNQIKVDCPGDIPAVINELNITPTTSAQTITPESGVDGFAPVNVAAVDSSVDENIVAENIKSGVTILGVLGSYEGTDEYSNVIDIENVMKGTSFVEEDEIDTACDNISMFLYGTANA